MKRQTLQLGGALLATTALSSAAYAGTVVNSAANGAAIGTAFTTASLSSQVFGSTGGSSVTLGPQELIIRTTNSLTTTFDLELEGSNSDFTGTIAVTGYEISGATLSGLTFTGCTVQVLTERILVEDCLATSAGSGFEAIKICGISYTNANGLATAGTSIALSGIIRGQSNNTFELVSSRNVVTSAVGVSDTITPNSSLTINNLASPAFTSLNGNATTGRLGNVLITATGAVGTNLTTTLLTDTLLAAGLEITVTHGVLTDAATDAITVTGTGTTTSFATTVIASAFNGNAASFNFTAGSILGSFDVNVVFDGSTAIQSWSAGTVAVAYTAGTNNLSAIPGDSGSLAALNRSGFSTNINSARSTAGDGGTLFQSFVRVTNNGSVAGEVLVTVRDGADGSSYGVYTTSSIAPNSTLQVGMATIESALSITPAAFGTYNLSITGAITGYAQHIVFNSVDNFFADFSGFRNGGATAP